MNDVTEVDYGIGESDLGLVLVGRTDNSVCAVFLGDDAQTLEVALARRFADVPLNRSDESVVEVLTEVLHLVASPGKDFAYPIKMVGTSFQKQVWEELRKIPAGETISYGELARRVGRPTAVRAVAGACGANRLALVIPCHRVIGANGSLTGYRWGTDRKQKLLSRE